MARRSGTGGIPLPDWRLILAFLVGLTLLSVPLITIILGVQG